MVNVDVMIQDLWSILGIVPKTLAMMLLIFVLAVLIGGVFAIIEHKKVLVLHEIIAAYRVVFKGPPLIIIVFLAYFAFPPVLQFATSLVGVQFDAYWTPNWVTLVVALTLYYSAFEAEIIKGALNSFDKGQADAAFSLGYTDRQMFRRIMFPQVVVTAIPDLTTSTLVIMKGLSLGFAIEVVEIFAQAQLDAALNYYYLEAFLAATVTYMIIAYIITKISDRAEAMLRLRS
ncbi:amino acid ABC transporter permease [Labrys wisconsinensis]|uniref:L-cystine transport system permease protein n=1 Tax=Labrys wisconsinensis TaxID=425677 RepID=A0ABU0J6Z1_9HYPH|nr:ABC transporter permease subunit [Labrys wisconsinensis]MDQ0470033.1 L-cystine transport system permease protein [Labrys wisconsinensis]